MRKYIFVTGGVLSGLGKGIAAASIGHLLAYKYKVVPMKLDGYLNTDPGTMNPQEHGEVFVLDDGSEVDMDFGHYERFLGCTCSSKQSLTMGKVFTEIQKKERKGDYLGKTVQFVPHVTDLIKEKLKEIGKEDKAEIVIIEIGGTVGDMENELFIEAARQLSMEVGKENSLFVHLTYVPIPDNVKEQKSKPTQQSIKLLLERGIMPDIIIARCKYLLADNIKRKISIYSSVPEKAVISGHDVSTVYEIPEIFYKQGMVELLNSKLCLNLDTKIKLKWPKLVSNLRNLDKKITIAICGKYTALEDSYASIIEALTHCSANTKAQITIKMIETTGIDSDEKAAEALEGADGVIAPGGFGNRGTEGKINIIKYARENEVPYLGICLGLQLAVIEFARNVCGIKEATSEEFKPKAKDKIIAYLPGQHDNIDKGGTLRLGSYMAILDKNSKLCKVYDGHKDIFERHRHRYEVNPEYHDVLRHKGMGLTGFSPDGKLVEFICIENHPYFTGTQAHPELKSKLEKPAPLFLGLVSAAIERRYKKG
jgi:CTP synthase